VPGLAAGVGPKSWGFSAFATAPNLYAAMQQRLHMSGPAVGQVNFCAVQQNSREAIVKCPTTVHDRPEDHQLTHSKVGISPPNFNLDR